MKLSLLTSLIVFGLIILLIGINEAKGDESNGNEQFFSDPNLTATFVGDSLFETGKAVIIDEEGFIYIAGSTTSPNFPTTEQAYDRSFNGRSDIFIAKFNANLSEMVFSTFIGGSDSDSAVDITLDNNNSIIIVGWTKSTDYPTSEGCYDSVYNGGQSDVVITKLSPDGSDILFSTYIGGSEEDIIDDEVHMLLDETNNIFVCGSTTSEDFPMEGNSFDPEFSGDFDMYMFHMNNNGTQLISSTYLGSQGRDAAIDLL